MTVEESLNDLTIRTNDSSFKFEYIYYFGFMVLMLVKTVMTFSNISYFRYSCHC